MAGCVPKRDVANYPDRLNIILGQVIIPGVCVVETVGHACGGGDMA